MASNDLQQHGAKPLRRLMTFEVGVVCAAIGLAALLYFAAAGVWPIDSEFRYTLEIEVAGQRYTTTSVAGALVYRKSEWLPPFGDKYRFRARGEGPSVRFADGRALAVKYPRFRYPPGYVQTDRSSVAKFVAEGESYPITYGNFTEAIIFDDATAPKTAWRFDWLDPERTLGAGARIIQFTHAPTYDAPTGELGKIVPWLAVRRHNQFGFRSDDDEWFGYAAYRVKLIKPEIRAQAKEVELSESEAPTTWLDASRFVRGGAWKTSTASDVAPIAIRYSDDLARITLIPDGDVPSGPTLFIQKSHMARRRPAVPSEDWTPLLCIAGAGCADVLPQYGGMATLIRPSDGAVFVIELSRLFADRGEFEKNGE